MLSGSYITNISSSPFQFFLCLYRYLGYMLILWVLEIFII
ncbi:hypothetical protein HMPREF1548_05115 [Clostridium sp. KLE 1755]|nr:hypothetical protein HMPREF1548_05115 [Clostridium sp. KLE 1755]